MGTHTSRAEADRKAQRRSRDGGAPDEVRVVLDGIRRIVQALRSSSRSTEARLGLSAAQLFVLLKLAGEEGLSINELAVRTLTHQSSVSVVVARLVEGGYVARTRSAVDARRVELALTRKGRATLAKAPEAAQDRLIHAIEALPRAQRRALGESLTKLSEALTSDGGVKSPSMLFE